MRDKRYIRNEFISRMHELRIKADEYWIKHHEEEREIWEGKYNCYDINPTQSILINGLSSREVRELRIGGLMPHKEYFDMWVRR